MEVYDEIKSVNLQAEFCKQNFSRLYLKEHNVFLLNLRDELQREYANMRMAELVCKRWNCETEKKDEKTFHFLTISPRVGTDFDLFKKKVEYLVTRPFIKDAKCRYSFEQTGETEEDMGYHPHAHFVFSRVSGYSPKNITDRVFSTFKSMGERKYLIRLDQCPESWRTEKILYIQGVKWDSKKENAVKINKIWRRKNALEDIYTV